MIIEAKRIPLSKINIAAFVLTRILKWRFNKLLIHPIAIKPRHSYLLICNHTSFWDGFWAAYLVHQVINKNAPNRNFYAMILKKQLQKNKWMRYFGCFSMAPFSKTKNESIAYAANILNTPGNVLLMYPQGNLESHYVRHIEMKNGISEILAQTKGQCQIIWSSNLIEYFESLKPSVHFHMMDGGTQENFDFNELRLAVDKHHQSAIEKHFRFTKENHGAHAQPKI